MTPVQFLINMFSLSGIELSDILVALLSIYWGKEGNLKGCVKELFGDNKLSTAEDQADHLADVTFYYASFVLLTSMTINLIRFIQRRINQALVPDTKFVQSLNETIKNSF